MSPLPTALITCKLVLPNIEIAEAKQIICIKIMLSDHFCVSNTITNGFAIEMQPIISGKITYAITFMDF